MQTASDHVGSYYAHRVQKHAARMDLEGRIQTEVCVVGGGLAGLTTARELARKGRRVLLLEAQRVGWGASGRNGGFVSAGYAEGVDAIERRVGLEDAKKLYALSKDGVNYVRSTIEEAGAQEMIGGHGWLKLIRHGDSEPLRRRCEKMVETYGASMEMWDRYAVKSVLSSDVYHYGLHDKTPFHINPLAYAQLLARQGEEAGLRIFEGSKVVKIARQGVGWRVDTPCGSVQAQTVVLATSAHRATSSLIPKIDRAVLPVATYVITTEPLGERLKEAIRFAGCIGDTRRAGDYYRIVEGDRLLWGGRITTRRSEPRNLARLLKRDILKIYPQLGDFKVDFAWSGLMGYAVHKMPLVGEVKPGLWAATALGGHGLNTTATVGELVASAIADGDDRWRLFAPYKAQWGGGVLGRLATQIVYSKLKFSDRLDERRGSSSQTGS